MFDDLDNTLKVLLNNELRKSIIDFDEIPISFATPDEQFPPSSVTLPAIDLFLYDIRESLELRTNEWIIERDKDKKITNKRRAPARVECSYLITAWPKDPTDNALDEHRLLGEVAKVLLRFPTIPKDFLQGSLKDQEPPLPTITLHQGRMEMMGQFWQALGGKLKVALNYTVTISMDIYEQIKPELVQEKILQVKLSGMDK